MVVVVGPRGTEWKDLVPMEEKNPRVNLTTETTTERHTEPG